MIRGQCNCQSVAFEISADVNDIYICHCSICRKATGTNGIAVIVVDKEFFRWIKGQDYIKTWLKPGHDWETRFCKQCGSKLPGKNDEARLYIPVGLLNDVGASLKVAHHIHVASKAAWDVIGDTGQQHPFAFQSE